MLLLDDEDTEMRISEEELSKNNSSEEFDDEEEDKPESKSNKKQEAIKIKNQQLPKNTTQEEFEEKQKQEEIRRLRRVRKRALKSSLINELRTEDNEEPEEFLEREEMFGKFFLNSFVYNKKFQFFREIILKTKNLDKIFGEISCGNSVI